jgi:hypothetical protein
MTHASQLCTLAGSRHQHAARTPERRECARLAVKGRRCLSVSRLGAVCRLGIAGTRSCAGMDRPGPCQPGGGWGSDLGRRGGRLAELDRSGGGHLHHSRLPQGRATDCGSRRYGVHQPAVPQRRAARCRFAVGKPHHRAGRSGRPTVPDSRRGERARAGALAGRAVAINCPPTSSNISDPGNGGC